MMLAFVTKSSAASLLLIGSALLISATDARAQTSAQERYNQAWEQCMDLPRGQQAFCWEGAHHQYLVDQAKEQNKDVVIHHDHDPTNDTPAQTKAKRTYEEATDRCLDVARGQRSFCMEEARAEYKKAMGW